MSEKTTPSVAAYTPYVKPPYAHAHLPVLSVNDVPDTVLMQTLYRALRVKRADGSQSEARFVAWLVNRLPVTMIDARGNVHVDLRTMPDHRTMFTSHTDTVHHGGGDNVIRLDVSDPDAIKWRADAGSCLGADDGAGVALMCHMIDRKVPGLYVFFRGEECGGVGSSWMDKEFSACLKDIDHCVSFDRADYMDVITHQGGSRCCSDAFAQALGNALTTDDLTLGFTPSNGGVFTDSANLTDHIPECTNLSVGYKHQHGDGEWQDVTFLARLADQLCLVDWASLPVERDPKVYESKWDNSYTLGKWQGSWLDDWEYKRNGTTEAANDAFKQSLIDALWDAQRGRYYELTNMLSEWMAPDKSYSYRHLIDCKRYEPEDYAVLALELEQGKEYADSVLDLLADELT